MENLGKTTSANAQHNNAGLTATDEVEKAARKAHARNKQNFELHVALIMRTDETTKSHAIVTAYAEGEAGLVRRLDK